MYLHEIFLISPSFLRKTRTSRNVKPPCRDEFPWFQGSSVSSWLLSRNVILHLGSKGWDLHDADHRTNCICAARSMERPSTFDYPKGNTRLEQTHSTIICTYALEVSTIYGLVAISPYGGLRVHPRGLKKNS